jgi:hypothetical protein
MEHISSYSDIMLFFKYAVSMAQHENDKGHPAKWHEWRHGWNDDFSYAFVYRMDFDINASCGRFLLDYFKLIYGSSSIDFVEIF